MLNPELQPTNSLLKPMKSHVAGLRHFGLDGLIGQAHSDFIVAMNRGGRLRVPKVGEHLSIFAAANVPPYSASCTEEQTTGIRVKCKEIGALKKAGSLDRAR